VPLYHSVHSKSEWYCQNVSAWLTPPPLLFDNPARRHYISGDSFIEVWAPGVFLALTTGRGWSAFSCLTDDFFLNSNNIKVTHPDVPIQKQIFLTLVHSRVSSHSCIGATAGATRQHSLRLDRSRIATVLPRSFRSSLTRPRLTRRVQAPAAVPQTGGVSPRTIQSSQTRKARASWVLGLLLC
jgi:hypothetical protein